MTEQPIKTVEQLRERTKTEQPKRLKHEQYYHQPHCNAPSHVKPFTKGVSCSCRKPDITEQPNQNLMTFEQIEGCCDIIEKLLNELVPKTEQVEGCIITHRSWRGNNLKHLRKAFE